MYIYIYIYVYIYIHTYQIDPHSLEQKGAVALGLRLGRNWPGSLVRKSRKVVPSING